jgi:flavin-dependent dehydrogenase
VFEFATVKRGYSWVFPRGDVMNVGVGTGRPGEGRTLRDRLAAFMQRVPELRGREVMNIKGGQLPDFCSPRTTFTDRGLYLVGDAAGFIDPLTGEGIHFAVLSGRRAAEAIVSGGNEARYEAALAAEMLTELRYAARYAGRYRRVPAWLFRTAMCSGRFRRYASHFVNILSGAGSYDAMWRALHPRRKNPPV